MPTTPCQISASTKNSHCFSAILIECRKVIGFALTTPRDWLNKKLAPLFHPIRRDCQQSLFSSKIRREERRISKSVTVTVRVTCERCCREPLVQQKKTLVKILELVPQKFSTRLLRHFERKSGPLSLTFFQCYDIHACAQRSICHGIRHYLCTVVGVMHKV